MEKVNLALEELRMLQDIIARHDEISFKLKGWCITLNIGVLAALYGVNEGKTIDINPVVVFVCLFLAILFFLWLDAIYRVAMDRAIQRTAKIEKQIRKNNFGEYPKINIALGRPNRIRDQINAINNIRVIAPYLIIVIIDLLALILKIQ